MPEVARLLIADRPEAWTAAGFDVDGDRTRIGAVEIRFVDGKRGGVIGWELAEAADLPPEIDGIATTTPTGSPAGSRTHPNGVSRLDHVVIITGDLDRTIGALEGAGFTVRRTRDIPGTDPVRRQVFLWAGEPILEVVGPAEPTRAPEGRAPEGRAPHGRTPQGPTGRASVWGLALTTDDLDQAAETLGASLSTPKPAVQPGRRIATVDTSALGIGPALALMTPHPG